VITNCFILLQVYKNKWVLENIINFWGKKGGFGRLTFVNLRVDKSNQKLTPPNPYPAWLLPFIPKLTF